MAKLLMPKATAVWLVDNTTLTFDQIADFCSLHPLEVKGIADGDVAQGIKGMDPIANGQLVREELDKAQADSGYRMQVAKTRVVLAEPKRKGPRYTPVSRRQDRPDAIMWLVRNHPELTDAQVCKLIGTTKPTITAVRERTHWNSANLKPVDPVTLGLCTQIELDAAVNKAAERRAKDPKYAAAAAKEQADETLRSMEETLSPEDTDAGTGDKQEQVPVFDPNRGSEVENPSSQDQGDEVDEDPLRRQVFGE